MRVKNINYFLLSSRKNLSKKIKNLGNNKNKPADFLILRLKPLILNVNPAINFIKKQ